MNEFPQTIERYIPLSKDVRLPEMRNISEQVKDGCFTWISSVEKHPGQTLPRFKLRTVTWSSWKFGPDFRVYVHHPSLDQQWLKTIGEMSLTTQYLVQINRHEDHWSLTGMDIEIDIPVMHDQDASRVTLGLIDELPRDLESATLIANTLAARFTFLGKPTMLPRAHHSLQDAFRSSPAFSFENGIYALIHPYTKRTHILFDEAHADIPLNPFFFELAPGRRLAHVEIPFSNQLPQPRDAFTLDEHFTNLFDRLSMQDVYRGVRKAFCLPRLVTTT